MEQQENWLPVKGLETRYLVSDQGRVKTIKFRFGDEWVLKSKITQAGYRYVVLTHEHQGNKLRAKGVSKLVAEAFLPNPMEYTEVGHLDSDKSNNAVSNLQWIEHDPNVRKKAAYMYRIWHQDTPDNYQDFKCQDEAEAHMKQVRVLAKTPNLNYHIYTHKGKPDRLGYCVVKIRMTKSEFEAKNNEQ